MFFYYFSIDVIVESGRLGRFINYSKIVGNCYIKLIEIKNRLYFMLMVLRDIFVGEEFLYDYGDRNKDFLEFYSWLKF